MKRFIILPAILIAGLVACNNDEKTSQSTVVDSVTTPPPTTNTNTVIVPDNTKMEFEKKYPNSSNVVWVRGNRNNATTTPETTGYVVTYERDGVSYTTWYDYNGDWIATATRVANDKLPAAVSKTIADKYAGYVIVEVDMENDKDMEVYEIELDKGGEKLKVHISPTGKVIERKTN